MCAARRRMRSGSALTRSATALGRCPTALTGGSGLMRPHGVVAVLSAAPGAPRVWCRLPALHWPLLNTSTTQWPPAVTGGRWLSGVSSDGASFETRDWAGRSANPHVARTPGANPPGVLCVWPQRVAGARSAGTRSGPSTEGRPPCGHPRCARAGPWFPLRRLRFERSSSPAPAAVSGGAGGAVRSTQFVLAHLGHDMGRSAAEFRAFRPQNRPPE